MLISIGLYVFNGVCATANFFPYTVVIIVSRSHYHFNRWHYQHLLIGYRQ